MKSRVFYILLVATGCASRAAPSTTSITKETSRSNETRFTGEVIRRLDAAEPVTATFLGAVHRQIHELWEFGFLEELKSRASSGDQSWQDLSLSDELEITLDARGAIRKVTVLQPSRYLPFDAAAVATIWNAGPFPAPPGHLQSPDGNTRISWTFHRDQQACSEKGAAVYLVLNPRAWERSRGKMGKVWDEFAANVRSSYDRFRKRRRARAVADAGISDSLTDGAVQDRAQ